MSIGHTLIGSGPEKVIVLHGWFSDYSAYAPMFDYLDRETISYAFMDYRGYGRSRDISGRHSMDEIADDAMALADELGWQRFHVIGHSMGGKAAQKIACLAQARIKSVICLTPVPAAAVPLDEASQKLFYGAPEQDQARYTIIDFTTGNRLSANWLTYMVRRSRETTTVAAFADYLRAWVEEDFHEQAMGLETPMLVVYGEHDQALTRELMESTFVLWYPRAQLLEMTNAGHYPMWETPVYLATAIESFVLEHA